MLKIGKFKNFDFHEIDETHFKDAVLNETWAGFKEDYLALHYLIRKYKPNTFLEIGTFRGDGTRVICNAVDGIVYSLELPYEDRLNYLNNEMDVIKNPGHICEFDYVQLYGDSTCYDYDSLENIEGWFIDGDHSYKNVCTETKNALKTCPKLIVWHDTHVSEVVKAILDSVPFYYDLYFCRGTRIAWAVPKEITLYTAITKDYDNLSEHSYDHSVAFVDDLSLSTEWELRSIEKLESPRLSAKRMKCMPHLYFDTEYSLWIDGNLDLNVHPRFLLPHLSDHDIATPDHPFRTCVYEEGREVVKNALDDPRLVNMQLLNYKKENHTTKWLPWCGVILRRHTKAINDFNELWWNEILNNSSRDQLSYNYILNKCFIAADHSIPSDFLNVRPRKN